MSANDSNSRQDATAHGSCAPLNGSANMLRSEYAAALKEYHNGEGDIDECQRRAAQSGPERFSAARGWALGAARRRFRALAILEAVGKASAAESNKLDRYQALLREKPSREMVSLWARQDWEHRCLMKMAGRVLRAAQRPNAAISDSPTETSTEGEK